MPIRGTNKYNDKANKQQTEASHFTNLTLLPCISFGTRHTANSTRQWDKLSS